MKVADHREEPVDERLGQEAPRVLANQLKRIDGYGRWLWPP